MPPPSAQALRRAASLFRQGQLAAAAEQCAGVLAQRPDNFDAVYLLGLIRATEDRMAEAAQLFERAAALNPRSFAAQKNLGIALSRLRRYDAAIAGLERALALSPRDVDTLNDLSVALAAAGRDEAALARFDEALALAPDDPRTHNNRGIALARLRRLAPAIASFERALALSPGDAELHNNLGDALRRAKRFAPAIANFERALTLRPNDARAHNNLGIALAETNRREAAIASFERALTLAPNYAEAHNNLGVALRRERRFETAAESFERALALMPNYVEALDNLGHVLKALRRYDEALAYFERALAVKPEDAAALGMRAALKRHICDWSGLEAIDAELVDAVRGDRAAIQPFGFLAVTDDPAAQLKCARQYWRSRGIAAPAPPPLPAHERGKLRLGYLSADFHDHATARLMAGLFERHDRSRFEIIAFSHGPEDGSVMRGRLRQGFDRFFDVREESDDDVARRIGEQEIDILIDLKGYTEDNRLDILALRPAPVQVHYLGYPGTLGTEIVDYLIVDRFLVPTGGERHFAEKLVYLPDCYQVNDAGRASAEPRPSRRDCGLPEHGFVFCCFNASYKIMPSVFAVWMRLLAAVPGSVLWLLADNRWAEENLRRAATARGVDPARLVFAPRRAQPEHLARHALADLFLDTLPVNAHTTASDALWAGLPVLTCAGNSMVARVASSLLASLGLDELITDTLEAYERQALMLAQDRERLAALRVKLAAARLSAPLFDTDRTRRQLEAAYLGMWEIRRRGEQPRSFAVAADLSISATE